MTRVARDRRGSAMLMLIAVVLIVEGAIAVMLLCTVARARMAADERWAIEGEVVAKTALAQARVHFATGALLPEGITQQLAGVRSDGWDWSVAVLRNGDLVRMTATAERHGPGGLTVAGSRATLFLRRLPSDTLQRLPDQSRF